MSVFISESLNHSFNRFIQSADSFRNQSSDCLWVSHWIIHLIDSFNNTDSFRKKLNFCLYKWVTESFIQRLIQSTDSFRNQSSDCLWVSHWIIHLIDSFNNTDSFRKKLNVCLYKWVTESLIQQIHSKRWFIQESIKWLSLSQSLNHSLGRFVQQHRFILEETKWLSL